MVYAEHTADKAYDVFINIVKDSYEYYYTDLKKYGSRGWREAYFKRYPSKIYFMKNLVEMIVQKILNPQKLPL